MDSLYNIIRDILNANESTVIVTCDTLHIILTLLIFIALMIFIWIINLDPCEKDEWKYEDINADKGTPRCIDADKSMFA